MESGCEIWNLEGEESIGQGHQRQHVEDPCIEGRIILKWILKEIQWEGMDWINVTQDRDSWPAIVKTVTNLRVP
jgi:hypothetical protein